MPSPRDGAVVLIVDDDEGIRAALRDALEEERFRVVTAIDGVDALRQLREGTRPSVILLDHMMPNMDGATFIRELRSDSSLPAFPVILITADGRAQAKSAALGIRSFLRKPVMIDQLLDAIAEVDAA